MNNLNMDDLMTNVSVRNQITTSEILLLNLNLYEYKTQKDDAIEYYLARNKTEVILDIDSKHLYLL